MPCLNRDPGITRRKESDVPVRKRNARSAHYRETCPTVRGKDRGVIGRLQIGQILRPKLTQLRRTLAAAFEIQQDRRKGWHLEIIRGSGAREIVQGDQEDANWFYLVSLLYERGWAHGS